MALNDREENKSWQIDKVNNGYVCGKFDVRANKHLLPFD